MIRTFDLTICDRHAKPMKKNNPELGLLAYETFFITEYISRYIRHNEIKNVEINGSRISQLIVCLYGDKNKAYQSSENTITCSLNVKHSGVFILKGINRIEKILEYIEQSSSLFESTVPRLGLEINNSINLFRKSEYKNIWTHKKKRIKGVGLAKLECELTPLNFFLSIIVENKKSEIFRKKILETRPNPGFYHHLFNSISLQENTLVVMDRIINKPIFTLTFDEVDKGEYGHFPYNENTSNTMRLDNLSCLLVEDLKLNPRNLLVQYFIRRNI